MQSSHYPAHPQFPISRGWGLQATSWSDLPPPVALLSVYATRAAGVLGVRNTTSLLSRCSRLRPCATPETAAHQAPPSLGFSRQEHWSGLPFPSPVHEVESEREVAQSCPTLSDPIDCSLPGSSVYGILQGRVLEWGAIAFSEYPLGWSAITAYYFSGSALGTAMVL